MAASRGFSFGVIGINHGHIYEQTQVMLDAGCRLKAFRAAEDDLAAAYGAKFPDAKRVADERAILEDAEIRLVVGAGILADRAPMAVRAMRHGKDVMLDKPGATTLEQLAELRRVQAETGRILSILYSEHYTQRATIAAGELVKAGAIGRVLQTVGLGPHRVGNYARPDWFWSRERTGGILVRHRLAPGRAVPVLHRRETAEVAASHSRQFRPSGQAGVRGLRRHTAALRARHRLHPRRLVHAGRAADLGRRPARPSSAPKARSSSGSISTSPAGRAAIICSSSTARAPATSIARDERSPTASSCATTCSNRTETAMPQAHCFLATELALKAQAQAVRIAARRAEARHDARLTVGVVGCGHRRGAHRGLSRALPELYEVEAICDIDAERRGKVAATVRHRRDR